MTLFNFTSASSVSGTAAGSRDVLSGPAYFNRGDVPGTSPAPQIPIDLVFHRLFRTEEHMRMRIEKRVTSESLAILLKRLAQQGQRVEAAGCGSSALTTRRTPQFADAKVSSPNTGGVSPAATRAGDQTTWQEFSRPASTINIDVLTDQVMRQLDSRIIAARERMGKI